MTVSRAETLAHSPCRVCGAQAGYFANAIILRKYDVRYFRCDTCGFIQTEEPYWLDEAYKDPIAEIDIGGVSRAIGLSRAIETVILMFFDCNARFVDYGGGYGLAVRILRDRGFDFYNFDRYTPNLFARAFEATEGDQPSYELATAIEVLEHLSRPSEDLARILAFSRNVLFNTLLVPASVPQPHQWWYYATEAGQHISFYTLPSLAVLAKRFGLTLLSDGLQFHLLTDKPISSRLFAFVTRPTIARVLSRALRRRLREPSLLERDFERVSGLRSK